MFTSLEPQIVVPPAVLTRNGGMSRFNSLKQLNVTISGELM